MSAATPTAASHTPPVGGLTAPPLIRRMACWLYEGMLLFGVVFIAGYLFSTLSQTRNAMDNRHLQQAFLFVVFGIYFTWFWAKGQTLAMKTWDIRVVDAKGQALSQPRALWRAHHLFRRLTMREAPLPPDEATIHWANGEIGM